MLHNQLEDEVEVKLINQTRSSAGQLVDAFLSLFVLLIFCITTIKCVYMLDL